MKIWRISNHADLSGIGGTFSSGRWNHLGTEIVYCSDHPATCLLEMLVRVDPDITPTNYQLLEVNVPDKIHHEEANLGADWQSNEDYTRTYWQEFKDENRAAILKVPSVLLPQSANYLLNPQHQDHSELEIIEIHRNILDERFVR